jgi:isopentenyl-diphosphate delta-isomerase
MNRETTHVELVDDTGTATGVATVEDAHRMPGMRHRAFSVLLVDPAGRLLLQRRAAEKTRFALRWANACCGHPAPGECVTAAAGRRLAEELGLAEIPQLHEVGILRYHAIDPNTERVEYEYDHVLAGWVPSNPPLTPDPAEVADLSWVHPDRLSADLSTAVERYAPWLSGVTSIWQSWPPPEHPAATAFPGTSQPGE